MGKMANSKKVWLITGASRGLGLALTRRVLARGGCVVAAARDPSAFADLLADPTIDHANLFPLALDVTWSFDKLRSAMDKAIARWGHVDVLVNNAGHGNIRPTEECSAEDLLALLSTNFLGVVGVTNALLPHFRARRSGKVIIIGSRSAYHNEYMGPGAYAATKAAVHAYGETLSAEMKPFNIGVMIVAPGAFESGIQIPICQGPIKDYDPIRQKISQAFAAREKDDTRGSPEKGMDCIVDVVNGEGRAAGKTEMPLWLFLGDDAISNVRARLQKMTRTVDEWECVGSRVSKCDC